MAERKRHVQLVVVKGNHLPPEAFVPLWLRRGDHGLLQPAELDAAPGYSGDEIGERERAVLRGSPDALPREWRRIDGPRGLAQACDLHRGHPRCDGGGQVKGNGAGGAHAGKGRRGLQARGIARSLPARAGRDKWTDTNGHRLPKGRRDRQETTPSERDALGVLDCIGPTDARGIATALGCSAGYALAAFDGCLRRKASQHAPELADDVHLRAVRQAEPRRRVPIA